jgi:hypothetical protein
MNIENIVANLSEKELQQLNQLFKQKQSKQPIYQYSRIRDNDLDQLFSIEKNIQQEDAFEQWFTYDYDFTHEEVEFFQTLIDKHSKLIADYSEEDLKANVLIPLINQVDFFLLEQKIRGFYEDKLFYQNDNFTFTGTVDFVVAQGLIKSKKPYFFIQEFKRGEEFSNPRPQLLAELISAVELNKQLYIRGAYVIGAIWNFVILEKLSEANYQYFVSANFDSTKLNDLKAIYKHLCFVKNELKLAAI